MKFRNLGRLGLALAGLVCLSAVFSASAFAAGKPSSVSVNADTYPGLNYIKVTALANPNGASTTLSIQNRAIGQSEWNTIGSKNIGSGTALVEITATQEYNTLGTKLEYRAVAENSFGSGTSLTETFGVRLKIWQSGITEDTASYKSTGSFKIEDSNMNRIECSASGGGEFGPEAVGGEHLNLGLSNCVWSWQNHFRCNPIISPEPLSFSREFVVPAAEILFRCPEEPTWHHLSYSGRFLTTLGSSTSAWWSAEVEKPVTMVGLGKIDSAWSTATISTTWALTGSNLGKKFYLKEVF